MGVANVSSSTSWLSLMRNPRSVLVHHWQSWLSEFPNLLHFPRFIVFTGGEHINRVYTKKGVGVVLSVKGVIGRYSPLKLRCLHVCEKVFTHGYVFHILWKIYKINIVWRSKGLFCFWYESQNPEFCNSIYAWTYGRTHIQTIIPIIYPDIESCVSVGYKISFINFVFLWKKKDFFFPLLKKKYYESYINIIYVDDLLMRCTIFEVSWCKQHSEISYYSSCYILSNISAIFTVTKCPQIWMVQFMLIIQFLI